MAEDKSGGPAFPQPPIVGPDGAVTFPWGYGMQGMDLRDYFAGQVLTALQLGFSSEADVAKRVLEAAGRTLDGTTGVIARAAYEIADAMLEARKR